MRWFAPQRSIVADRPHREAGANRLMMRTWGVWRHRCVRMAQVAWSWRGSPRLRLTVVPALDTGGDAKQAMTPLRAERRMCSALSWWTYSCACFSMRMRLRMRHASGVPCALGF